MLDYNINLDYNFNCYLDKLSEYGVPDNVINKIKQEIDDHYQLLYHHKIQDKSKEIKLRFENEKDQLAEESYDEGYEDGYIEGVNEKDERIQKKFFKLGFEKGYTVGFADGSIDHNRTDMDELIETYYKEVK